MFKGYGNPDGAIEPAVPENRDFEDDGAESSRSGDDFAYIGPAGSLDLLKVLENRYVGFCLPRVIGGGV